MFKPAKHFQWIVFSAALTGAAPPASAAELQDNSLQITVTAAPRAKIDTQAQAAKLLAKASGNTHVADAKEWQGQKAVTVKDITDYIPGVIAAQRNGAESARLSLRGSGLSTTFQGRGLMVMEDGIPINMADGEFEFPVIDPWLTKFAEVYPGASALQYGSSTLGGAINFVTENGSTNPGYSVRALAGSFGTLEGGVTAGKKAAGGDAFISASDFHQDGFRQNNKEDISRVNLNFGWQPVESFSSRFNASHIHSDAEIPGAISEAAIADDPSQANQNNINGHYARNLDITRLANKSAWEEGRNRVEATVFVARRTLDNPVTTYEFQHNNDAGLLAKHIHHFDYGGIFTSGVNFYDGTADESRYQNTAGTTGAPILTRSLSATTTEAFGEYEHPLLPKLALISGAQLSHATRNIEQITPAAAEQDRTYNGISPRLGLRYDASRALTLFTNLSRSYEPPTFGELSGGNAPGFNDLSAQKAVTSEWGGRGDLGQLHWSAAYYHAWLQDEFVNYRFASGVTDTINAAHTRHDGVELGLGGDVLHNIWRSDDAFALRFAYTWSHFRLHNDALYGDNKLPGVPEHLMRAEVMYKHPSGLSLGPNVEWAPQKYPVDLTNSLYTKPYAVAGARMAYDSADGARSLYIEGRNLLDRHFIATTSVVPDAAGADGNYFYPGEGRAVYAGMKISF